MGRPSLVAASPPTRRTTRRQSDDDSTVEEFPRRHPRIGVGYQVKTLPSLSNDYSTQRPAPVKMSSEIPFRTMDEVETGTVQKNNGTFALLFVCVRRQKRFYRCLDGDFGHE